MGTVPYRTPNRHVRCPDLVCCWSSTGDGSNLAWTHARLRRWYQFTEGLAGTCPSGPVRCGLIWSTVRGVLLACLFYARSVVVGRSVGSFVRSLQTDGNDDGDWRLSVLIFGESDGLLPGGCHRRRRRRCSLH
ncbi:unnamed protein product [Soboliphyme baturini]|uniref:Retrotransposon hot spot (RHS) protein n=1 Tax=Soboliphyme baturini TaxID=241478 RepID=A0A183ILB4_9BILA|nr:unnamed protein product [Soboliphyme baturini]